MKSYARLELERALLSPGVTYTGEGGYVFDHEMVKVRAGDLRDYLAETLDPDDAPVAHIRCPVCNQMNRHAAGCIVGRTPVDTGNLRRKYKVRGI